MNPIEETERFLFSWAHKHTITFSTRVDHSQRRWWRLFLHQIFIFIKNIEDFSLGKKNFIFLLAFLKISDDNLDDCDEIIIEHCEKASIIANHGKMFIKRNGKINGYYPSSLRDLPLSLSFSPFNHRKRWHRNDDLSGDNYTIRNAIISFITAILYGVSITSASLWLWIPSTLDYDRLEERWIFFFSSIHYFLSLSISFFSLFILHNEHWVWILW